MDWPSRCSRTVYALAMTSFEERLFKKTLLLANIGPVKKSAPHRDHGLGPELVVRLLVKLFPERRRALDASRVPGQELAQLDADVKIIEAPAQKLDVAADEPPVGPALRRDEAAFEARDRREDERVAQRP